MNRTFRIVRSHDEIALVTRRGGRTFLALLALEIALTAIYLAGLSRVAVNVMDFMLPLTGCVALIGWTAFYVRPDMRLTLNLADRSGRLVRISPLTGRRTATAFGLDDVGGLGLRSVGGRPGSNLHVREYAIDVALRSGGSHELRVRGPLMQCRSTLEQFCRAAGLLSGARQAGLGNLAPAKSLSCCQQQVGRRQHYAPTVIIDPLDRDHFDWTRTARMGTQQRSARLWAWRGTAA